MIIGGILSLVSPTFAQDAGYGRFDGDLFGDVALGGGVAFDDMGAEALTTGEIRLRYLDSAGVFVAAEWRPETDSRVLMGVDFRPFFLFRLLLGLGTENRWLDLWLDSIGLDMGVALLPLDESVGAGFTFGTGMDLPLAFFSEGYPILAFRLATRYVRADPRDVFGTPEPVEDWSLIGQLVVRWQASSGLTRWEPSRYRLRSTE